MHPNEFRRRLSVADAAQYLGLSPSTLNKYRSTRSSGPTFLKLGRRILYDTADLEAWLEASRRRSTADGSEV